MREESLRVEVEGHLLHQLVLHPPVEIAVRAEAIFYHGQGDYAERYLDVLHPFTNRGIRCTITVLAQIASRGNLPCGVMGHSMGGLLALRHLALAGRGKFPVPAFAWLSSPLLNPGLGRPAFFIHLVRFLAPLLSSLSFSTRVKPEDCHAKPEDNDAVKLEQDDPVNPLKAELSHKRISMAWGVSLMDFAELVAEGAGEIPAAMPLLFTQGGEDPVCPPELARKIFSRLPPGDKRYEELEGILHEPFRGDGSELLYAVLDDWLDNTVLNQALK